MGLDSESCDSEVSTSTINHFLFSVTTPRELNIVVGICKNEHHDYYKANSDGNLHYASSVLC